MFEVPNTGHCPFCDYLSGAKRCAFVSRLPSVSSFMNRTQYERGALLVVPNEHRETVLHLDSELLGSIYAEAQRLSAAMAQAFGAVAVNVFSNNGVQAGQSIPHVHIHVVPRYATSEPFRSFRAEEFTHASIEELEELANELQAVLPA